MGLKIVDPATVLILGLRIRIHGILVMFYQLVLDMIYFSGSNHSLIVGFQKQVLYPDPCKYPHSSSLINNIENCNESKVWCL